MKQVVNKEGTGMRRWRVIISSMLMVFITVSSASAQYMGCPELLTGICPPGTVIADIKSTAKKSIAVAKKVKTVVSAVMSVILTFNLQRELMGLVQMLKEEGVAHFESPDSTETMSSVKEGETPIETPKVSQIDAEEDKIVDDSGTLETVTERDEEETIEYQENSLYALARALVYKEYLKELEKMVTQMEVATPDNSQGKDSNRNIALRVNAGIRLTWSDLLTFKQQLLALRLLAQAEKVKKNLGPITASIMPSEASGALSFGQELIAKAETAADALPPEVSQTVGQATGGLTSSVTSQAGQVTGGLTSAASQAGQATGGLSSAASQAGQATGGLTSIAN